MYDERKFGSRINEDVEVLTKACFGSSSFLAGLLDMKDEELAAMIKAAKLINDLGGYTKQTSDDLEELKENIKDLNRSISEINRKISNVEKLVSAKK